ncbi:MAG: hypothetical protein CVV64_04360 [Candidatus Wallbacteria bacterium HGW-Wallbacteria-1]|uniref:UspA domain-containing protein n=1 Tax=Candidatus Wallbacteria bacterium HGW-Wallbacteria-1 TaxID=2013854 RepID=A0A2N1PRP0_9BACT|nr:MAG: hypothetical protein CVV64_04360 [Candidatus Wallbacteria bacterium HGW-Wallbacteria-1]
MKNILVPVDFSEVTGDVLNTASELARSMEGKIILLYCVEPSITVIPCCPGEPLFIPNDLVDLNVLRESLSAYEIKVRDQGIQIDVLIEEGAPELTIPEIADRTDASYIVMGSHGHGALYHLLLGSVSEQVLQRVSCPVVVVKSKKPVAQEGKDNQG